MVIDPWDQLRSLAMPQRDEAHKGEHHEMDNNTQEELAGLA